MYLLLLTAEKLMAWEQLLVMVCRKKIMQYRHEKQSLDACQRLQESKEAKEVFCKHVARNVSCVQADCNGSKH